MEEGLLNIFELLLCILLITHKTKLPFHVTGLRFCYKLEVDDCAYKKSCSPPPRQSVNVFVFLNSD
jgi:hypothetical protein